MSGAGGTLGDFRAEVSGVPVAAEVSEVPVAAEVSGVPVAEVTGVPVAAEVSVRCPGFLWRLWMLLCDVQHERG